jgi:glycosyltransferase involved in cell wall biosynthesis
MPADASLLIVSHEQIGPQMAGPGIRYYQMARVIGAHLPVTLAAPRGSRPVAGVTMAFYESGHWPSLQPLVAQTTTVLLPSDLARFFPELVTSDAVIIIDGYNPLLAEWLATYTAGAAADLRELWADRLRAALPALIMGDLYLCASERQRDWWLGHLEAAGRLNLDTYRDDPAFNRLVQLAGYGLEVKAPNPAPLIRNVWPGIGSDDKLLVWGGGLWPWLDPLSAIRAIPLLQEQWPTLRLIFPGTRHPNPALDAMPTHRAAAIALAEELGLLDRSVFFGDWVPYDRWQDLLRECDVAVSLHIDTLETRLAYRSRTLESIAAGIPTVATRGDAMSALLEERRVGIAVEVANPESVAQGIQRLLEEPPSVRAEHFHLARAALRWERLLAPLIDFVLAPRRAPDRSSGYAAGHPVMAELQAEAANLRSQLSAAQRQITAYEQGRFMRLMRSVDRWRRSLSGRP